MLLLQAPNGAGMTDLGTLGGAKASWARGINASGQVVGDSFTFPNDYHGYHAFITGPNGAGMTDLGTLGGDRSNASGINASGQVVGDSYITPAGAFHAFITGPNGAGMTDLGTLGGISGYFSSASGINDSAQVVGWSETSGSPEHAFITGPNGVGMTDLNSLVSLPSGIVLTEATAINNMGQVVVLGVPEPAAYVLMIVGLGLVGFVANRRKQAGETERWRSLA